MVGSVYERRLGGVQRTLATLFVLGAAQRFSADRNGVVVLKRDGGREEQPSLDPASAQTSMTPHGSPPHSCPHTRHTLTHFPSHRPSEELVCVFKYDCINMYI